MAGLATALSLKDHPGEITIVERDPAPPTIDPRDAFEHWKRPGVPQLRHTHFFLARLHSILRRHHPALLAELAEVGVVPGTMDQLLPATQAAHYVESAGDREMLHLWGRRATVEYVLRRHVERMGRVKFLHDTTIEDLAIARDGDQLRVSGVTLRTAEGRQLLAADTIVDATGRRTRYADQLRDAGAQIHTEALSSQCGYYCRHFVQTSSEPEPPRRGTGASLDYLVYGIFFAEQNTFSIALAVPELETELLAKLRRPEGFDEVCDQIPALRLWRSRSESMSRVMGGAELANRWNHYGRRGAAHVLGYFPVGDSFMQTNPIYGRGCSSAFVQAQLLAETFAKTRDERARAVQYHRGAKRLLRPHFDFCVAADRAFIARAKQARGDKVSFADRMLSHIYEAAFLPALEESGWVAREWLRAQQMCELAPPWVALSVLLYALARWPLRGFRRAPALPASGPERSEMLRLCLPASTRREDAS
ncbi:MAG TPA: hypothetical protein VHZ95_12060 [Polyangiales bacterium]|nr:hypothetical protein [Polyangiales bacterium]